MVEQTLKGKIAVVSGSARGIGAAVCVELASKGAKVVVNYPWEEEKPQALLVLDRIRATGSPSANSCVAIEADLSTVDGPAHLIAETVKTFGDHIDILVNNAAIAIMRPLSEATLEQWDLQVNLNGRGVWLLTKAVLPHLANPSRIVVISSAGARQAYASASVYNGTKSMVESFVRCWALELGRKYGCTVNAVAPGPTNTSGMNSSTPEFLKEVQPLLDAAAVSSEMADPKEMANGVSFLCEDKSRWITGICLPINGGFFIY